MSYATNTAPEVRLGPEEPAGSIGSCFHCGTPVGPARWAKDNRAFCCAGCLTVYELLTTNGLEDFYRLGPAGGVPVRAEVSANQYRFLDEPAVRRRLVDFCDGRRTRMTLRLPAIHCVACVWLLENLFRLKPGLAGAQVNFPRRELTLTFAADKIQLSEIACLLARLGYEPDLRLSDLDGHPRKPNRKLLLQLGVAGFAFGNIMLLSFPVYFGLDSLSGPMLRRWFGFLSLALALPVLFYSAQDYWRSAWVSLRQRALNIEVPIAIGLAAFFAQSTFEVVSGRGEGYFDSLAGLVFFLLCGRWFQQKSYERLSFDRDYRSFFPLSVNRLRPSKVEPERVSLAQIGVGDRLAIRHGELIPADAILVRGIALIDYSFVTGESDPVSKEVGEQVFAGGRQTGSAIEVETVKPVSQSYLASLWNQAAFGKENAASLQSLTNRVSRWFTVAVIALAVATGLYWLDKDPALAARTFTAVLIIACPCALAMSAPFAFGTAQRVLARGQVFLKNAHVLETLARVDTIVFDKTGTLTLPGGGQATFHGGSLSLAEQGWVGAVSRQSVHPLAERIGQALPARGNVQSFREIAGRGVEGQVEGHAVAVGSAAWLAARGVDIPLDGAEPGSSVQVALDGVYRGRFEIEQPLRPALAELIERLRLRWRLALLSGDQPRLQDRFKRLFGEAAPVRFQQTPIDKLEFVEALRQANHTVCMVGDGLNDAGALQRSDVGIAVVERVGMFSPASDVIMPAGLVSRLDRVLAYARGSVGVVFASFAISLLYNVAGIQFAARGLLSPVLCAILMPLSSVTVIAFATGLTRLLGKRLRLNEADAGGDA